jgi:hypothetical protein
MCAAKGRAVPATIVDHVQPHKGDWNRFLTGKLQSLCAHCHESDKKFEELNGYQRITFGVDGWPINSSEEAERSTTPSSARAKPFGQRRPLRDLSPLRDDPIRGDHPSGIVPLSNQSKNA